MPAKAQKSPEAPPLNAALKGAERTFESQGLRLTDKRRRLLATLLAAAGPLSAYELAHAYREQHGQELPVMTVYRMLEVFTDAGLVHRLRSTNSFIACRHMACDHPHARSQFLICDNCGRVQEMAFAEAELRQLQRKARSTGFHLHREQLELHGLCEDCHDAAPGAARKAAAG